MRRSLMCLAMAACLLCGLATASISAGVGQKYPHLWVGVMGDGTPAKLADGMIVSAKGVSITEADLDSEIAKVPTHLRDSARQYPAYALERMVMDKLLAVEAEAWAKQNGKTGSPEALVNQYVEAKVPAARATDKDARDFYDRNPGMFGNSKFEEIRESLKGFVANEKTTQAREEYRRSVGKRQKLQVSESWMKAHYQTWSSNPVTVARASGKPTVAIFSVVGCCEKKMYPVSQDMSARYGKDLNIVFFNIRQSQVLCELHGVFTMPVEIIYDAKGKEVFRRQGAMTADEILAELAKHGIRPAAGAR